jgi:septum formation protein
MGLPGEPLLLASRSPRRAALLREAGIPFEQGAVPDVDESLPPARPGRVLPPDGAVEQVALRKAAAAAIRAPDRLLLAADTLVFLDAEVLGKPRDAEEARRMLTALSGRAHLVATGVAVTGLAPDGVRRTLSGAASTRVVFRRLSEAEVEAYVAGGEPLGKAGAYALQGTARSFVERLEGREDTVIGLPVDLVRRLLGAWPGSVPEEG